MVDDIIYGGLSHVENLKTIAPVGVGITFGEGTNEKHEPS